MVAYEPVWAIGTGEVATPDDAQEVCEAIRGRIAEVFGDEAGAKVRILYGGSVKAANVAGIMTKADVDGCLVGGREPPARRVRRNLPLLRHAGHLNRSDSGLGFLPWKLCSPSCSCLSSLLLIMLILLHKGRGGGLSDMFGGGCSSGLGGSSVAEKNLDRITIGAGVIWVACIIALGLLLRAGG